MTFTEDLKESLIEKKNIKPKTAVSYIKYIIKLNGGKEPSSLLFLNNLKTVLGNIKDYAKSSQITYLTAGLSALSLFTSDKKYLKIYSKINDYIKSSDRKAIKDKQKEKQKDKMLDWNEVLDVHQKLKDNLKGIKLNKNINMKDYNKVLYYMVLSLYALIPPRRNEYRNMQIIKNYKNKTDISNYLDLGGKQFIFNDYKTVKKHKKQIQKIPDELFKIIKTFLKVHPLYNTKMKQSEEAPFLCYYDGGCFDSVNSITRVLNKIFGKKVGSSSLRHSLWTHKHGKDLEEMKDLATKMGHTVDEAQQTYILNDKE